MRAWFRSGCALTASAALAMFLIAGSAEAADAPARFISQSTASVEGVGDYTSLALDQLGNMHVAYFDHTRGALIHAIQTLTGWQTEVVDGSGTAGWYASLALDSHDNPHIAYYDVDQGVLKYAARLDGEWQTMVVDPSVGAGHYCSLALDAQDNPGISYHDAEKRSLRYASLRGEWSVETVDDGMTGVEAEPIEALRQHGGRAAVPDFIPNVGHYSSLAFDAAGRPHISYQDIANADLKFGVKLATGWDLETVDTAGDVGEHTSLKLDPAGNGRISYYSLQEGTLKFASQTPDGWVVETVDATDNVGAYSSLALDTQGSPHISYMNAGAQTLKYVTHQDGVWMVVTVDADGATGRNTSLALTRSGLPVIAYTAVGQSAFRVVSAGAQFDSRPAVVESRVVPAGELAAWPQPYRSGALKVSFVMPSTGASVEVNLINVAGRRIRRLSPGALNAGRQVLTWDGQDDAGQAVPSGVYFLVSSNAGKHTSLKLVVTR